MPDRSVIIEEIGKLLAGSVANAPKSPEAIELTIALWRDDLADLSNHDFRAALKALRRDPTACQFWPQPGTILARVPGRRLEEIDTADQAWGRVVQGIRRYGSMDPPAGMRRRRDPEWVAESWHIEWDFGPNERPGDRDAVYAGIDACGGWQDLCMKLTADTEGTLRKSFRDTYRAHKKQKRLGVEERKVLQLLDGGLTTPSLETSS